ncbi:hypothetical protein NHJ13734_006023, partial [Beauveria thailandica]
MTSNRDRFLMGKRQLLGFLSSMTPEMAVTMMGRLFSLNENLFSIMSRIVQHMRMYHSGKSIAQIFAPKSRDESAWHETSSKIADDAIMCLTQKSADVVVMDISHKIRKQPFVMRFNKPEY